LSEIGRVSGYEWITMLAKQLNISVVDELLAMHRTNDPFFTGTKAHRRRWTPWTPSCRAYLNGMSSPKPIFGYSMPAVTIS
jgi:hypothetical protein